jgi:hypothetical protein
MKGVVGDGGAIKDSFGTMTLKLGLSAVRELTNHGLD